MQVEEPLELRNHLQHYMLGAGLLGKLLLLNKVVNVLDMAVLDTAVLDMVVLGMAALDFYQVELPF